MGYNQYMFDLQSLRRPVAMMAAEVDLHFASGTDTPRETERGPHVVVEEAEPEIRRPPLFKVVLNNDDYTPMEFVVEVLQTIFGIDRNQAVRIMLYVHTRGKGVAGVFTYEIAETKAAQVNEYARQQQHPLLCTLEAV